MYKVMNHIAGFVNNFLGITARPKRYSCLAHRRAAGSAQLGHSHVNRHQVRRRDSDQLWPCAQLQGSQEPRTEERQEVDAEPLCNVPLML